MFWVWVCLGLGLICVGISMVVGIFVGEILGSGVDWLGELKRGLKGWYCGGFEW